MIGITLPGILTPRIPDLGTDLVDGVAGALQLGGMRARTAVLSASGVDTKVERTLALNGRIWLDSYLGYIPSW